MKLHCQYLPIIAVVLAAAAPVAGADSQQEGDWPCEQAYVPEVAAAVVWDGPSTEGLQQEWTKDNALAALAHKLTSRRADPKQDEPQIEAFAKAQPPGERNQRLTLLFAGVLRLLNEDRHQLTSGILRYARDQQRRADALGDQLAEIARLESDPSQAAQQRVTEMRREMQLEQRMFDDRERTIPYLCARPRLVEQRIGELARTISYQLE